MFDSISSKLRSDSISKTDAGLESTSAQSFQSFAGLASRLHGSSQVLHSPRGFAEKVEEVPLVLQVGFLILRPVESVIDIRTGSKPLCVITREKNRVPVEPVVGVVAVAVFGHNVRRFNSLFRIEIEVHDIGLSGNLSRYALSGIQDDDVTKGTRGSFLDEKSDLVPE
jgi:hypothetical protein